MNTVAWSRIDDKFHRNEKLAPLSDSAIALYVRAISWSSENLTDGFIPLHALPHLAPNVALGRSYDFEGNLLTFAALLGELEQAQAFEVAVGGHRIHDYLEFNEQAVTVKARREKKNGLVPAHGRGIAPVRGRTRDASAPDPAPVIAPDAPVIAPDPAPNAGALPGSRNPEPEYERDEANQARARTREEDADDFFPEGYGEEPQVMPDYEAPPPNPTSAPDRTAARKGEPPATAIDLAELQRFFGTKWPGFRDSWDRAMERIPNASARRLNDWLAHDLERWQAQKLPEQPKLSDAERFKQRMIEHLKDPDSFTSRSMSEEQKRRLLA